MNAPLTESQQESLYLSRLGERVRAWRIESGTTRKALAAASAVSERYLAQLEAGQGNISVLLLRRVARAMGVAVESLVKEDDAAPQRERIALIGLRGAGKSTLGRMLAEDLGFPFVELSREIEKLAGCSVSEIQGLYGQNAYRRYERRAVEDVVQLYQEAVIATPGGLVSDPATLNLLLSHCTTVWLQAAPEDHMSRVIAQGDMRPMAHSQEAMEDLKGILAGRTPFYSKAQFRLDTSAADLAETFQALRRLVGGVVAGEQ
jgi:XRE family aerobic/anaerobic benzoate catabolism transcriptional regulator